MLRIHKELHSQKTVPEAVMAMAEMWATLRSKDPKTKVGACVYDWATGQMHFGYNGFAPGLADKKDWWTERKSAPFGLGKHDLVVHAEANAIRKALTVGNGNTSRCELFVTHAPCLDCLAKVIAPAGIMTVTHNMLGPSAGILRNKVLAIAGMLDIRVLTMQERLRWHGEIPQKEKEVQE